MNSFQADLSNRTSCVLLINLIDRATDRARRHQGQVVVLWMISEEVRGPCARPSVTVIGRRADTAIPLYTFLLLQGLLPNHNHIQWFITKIKFGDNVQSPPYIHTYINHPSTENSVFTFEEATDLVVGFPTQTTTTRLSTF